ncbi:MAG: porin [Hyphomicrobiales bacterium]
MKLTSLLLSSAAVLVAGSAFAADLPAKKAAPAAAVVACPAFGAGFFQLPGSDTCIQLSGYVRYDATYKTNPASDATNTSAKYTQAGGYRLNLDARSNTEMGVVRGFGRLDNGALGKAYVQFAGLSAGKQDSLADIAGTTADQFGAGWSQSSNGINYTMAFGAGSFAIGLEDANNNNGNQGTGTSAIVSDRPDILAQVSGKFGPVGVKVAGVSHEAINDVQGTGTKSGYALLGQLTADVGGGLGVIVFGGMSDAAGKYTGATNRVDYDGSKNLKGSSIGAELNAKVGSAGLVAIAGVQNEHKLGTAKTTMNSYSVFYQHTVAKGLTIRPEYLWSETKNSGSTTKTKENTLYLRINRDF